MQIAGLMEFGGRAGSEKNWLQGRPVAENSASMALIAAVLLVWSAGQGMPRLCKFIRSKYLQGVAVMLKSILVGELDSKILF